MTSALQRAIDSLSNPEITVAPALRQLLVVGHRIEAKALTTWIRSELDGYAPDMAVPEYRDGSSLSFTVVFDGPMGSRLTKTVNAAELPSGLTSILRSVDLRMPVAELEALAEPQGQGSTGFPLPGWWVELYRQAMQRDEAPGYVYYVANEAIISTPRTLIVGILDRIRTTALELALEVEGVSSEAGSSDGPTVASDPELSQVVTSHMTMIYAAAHSNVSVASGASASAVQLVAGDVEGLVREAGNLLREEGLLALQAALEEDGNEPAEATNDFLRRLKDGTYGLATGITTNAAYDGVLALLRQVFPGTFG